MKQNIGIGSRVSHEKHGKGVVINIRSDVFLITFIDTGYKEIPVGEALEVLDDMAPDTDTVSLYEVEKTLKKIFHVVIVNSLTIWEFLFKPQKNFF